MNRKFNELPGRTAQLAVRRRKLTSFGALMLLLASPVLAQQSSNLPVMDVPNDPVACGQTKQQQTLEL